MTIQILQIGLVLLCKSFAKHVNLTSRWLSVSPHRGATRTALASRSKRFPELKILPIRIRKTLPNLKTLKLINLLLLSQSYKKKEYKIFRAKISSNPVLRATSLSIKFQSINRMHEQYISMKFSIKIFFLESFKNCYGITCKPLIHHLHEYKQHTSLRVMFTMRFYLRLTIWSQCFLKCGLWSTLTLTTTWISKGRYSLLL